MPSSSKKIRHPRVTEDPSIRRDHLNESRSNSRNKRAAVKKHHPCGNRRHPRASEYRTPLRHMPRFVADADARQFLTRDRGFFRHRHNLEIAMLRL